MIVGIPFDPLNVDELRRRRCNRCDELVKPVTHRRRRGDRVVSVQLWRCDHCQVDWIDHGR